jgi:hypothetical protein
MLLMLLELEVGEQAQWKWWLWLWWFCLEAQGLAVRGLVAQGLVMVLQWWVNRFHIRAKKMQVLPQPTAAIPLQFAPCFASVWNCSDENFHWG